MLITDRWLSPIAGVSAEVQVVPTKVGTTWNTSVAALTLIEAMIADISDRDCAATRKRIEMLERPASPPRKRFGPWPEMFIRPPEHEIPDSPPTLHGGRKPRPDHRY